MHNYIYYDNTVTSFYESAAEEFYPIQVQSFLGVFTKLRKEIISSIMSVCLSVHPPTCMEQLGSHWMDFHELRYLSIFQKSVKKIQISLKSDNNNRYVIRTPMYIFIIHHPHLLQMRNVSDNICRENQISHFVFNNFFSKFLPFMR